MDKKQTHTGYSGWSEREVSQAEENAKRVQSLQARNSG